MKKFTSIIILIVTTVLLSRAAFNAGFLKKSHMTEKEQMYAEATLRYYQSLLDNYPDCKLNKPQEPVIFRVSRSEVSKLCGEDSLACFLVSYNILVYEENDMARFVHEYTHVILTRNTIAYPCFQELVIQQMDYIFYEKHFKNIKEGQ